MSGEEVTYEELFRIPIADKTDALVSKQFREGKHTGYYLNEFVRTPRYTGPTKGAFIPKDKWAEFKAKINTIS